MLGGAWGDEGQRQKAMRWVGNPPNPEPCSCTSQAPPSDISRRARDGEWYATQTDRQQGTGAYPPCGLQDAFPDPPFYPQLIDQSLASASSMFHQTTWKATLSARNNLHTQHASLFPHNLGAGKSCTITKAHRNTGRPRPSLPQRCVRDLPSIAWSRLPHPSFTLPARFTTLL